MATNDTLKNQLSKQQTGVSANSMGFKGLMSTPTMKKKFQDILHDKTDAFMGSLMTLVAGDDYLSQAAPVTIIAAALKAATMDLPIDKNLGYAYIIPFNRKEQVGKNWITHNEAQFIVGYKGYIQLAQRSGQYKSLNVIEVYEGELVSWNKLTEEFEYDPDGKVSDNVIGYVGYFELLNGFKKTVYWTKQEVEAHRIKHNKGRNKSNLTGAWKDNYDAMAIKTVLRSLLSKWGILSIEMQSAISSDEKIFKPSKDTNDFEEVEIKVAEEVEEASGIPEKVEQADEYWDSIEEDAQEALFDPVNPDKQ